MNEKEYNKTAAEKLKNSPKMQCANIKPTKLNSSTKGLIKSPDEKTDLKNIKTLANEIKKIRSNIPVILCTGFNETIGHDASELGVDHVLIKPFIIAELAKTIRDVLN